MANITLANAHYLSLATFRKTGVEVRTPVWFAMEDTTMYVFSSGNAGKVKRLRNSRKARVAPCDIRGNILGDWQDAEAEIFTDESKQRNVDKALARKYGWRFSGLDLLASIFGRKKTRAYIAVRLLKPGETAGQTR